MGVLRIAAIDACCATIYGSVFLVWSPPIIPTNQPHCQKRDLTSAMLHLGVQVSKSKMADVTKISDMKPHGALDGFHVRDDLSLLPVIGHGSAI
jgi:hypothetical protein